MHEDIGEEENVEHENVDAREENENEDQGYHSNQDGEQKVDEREKDIDKPLNYDRFDISINKNIPTNNSLNEQPLNSSNYSKDKSKTDNSSFSPKTIYSNNSASSTEKPLDLEQPFLEPSINPQQSILIV